MFQIYYNWWEISSESISSYASLIPSYTCLVLMIEWKLVATKWKIFKDKEIYNLIINKKKKKTSKTNSKCRQTDKLSYRVDWLCK